KLFAIRYSIIKADPDKVLINVISVSIVELTELFNQHNQYILFKPETGKKSQTKNYIILFLITAVTLCIFLQFMSKLTS
ncbi:TPA: hypothetical protein ACIAEZ_005588, partial [Escherichia coli]